MAAGVYDLPVPQGTALLVPDALLIPVVGIGEHGDRLGYGGGFFDRTLAILDPQPLKVALAFELSRLPSTDPQPHDVLMDFVVTEAGILAVTAAGLEPLVPARCRERVAAIAVERGLPRPHTATSPPG
jgi:5-formyltetrahydrofolate cyclo-ligase